MVADEVLARASQVDRVEVTELPAHTMQDIDRDIAFRRDPSVFVLGFEDVIEDGIGQLFGTNDRGRRLAPVEDSMLKDVRNRIVRHIDRRITQRLDHEFGIERQRCTQAERTRACPLLEPVHNVDELLLRDIIVRFQTLSDMLLNVLAPVLLAVLFEPLVRLGNNALVPRTGNDFTFRFTRTYVIQRRAGCVRVYADRTSMRTPGPC